MVLPLKTYVFIGLNVVRALSIVTLLLVFSSQIVVLVNDIQAFKSHNSPLDPSSSILGGNSTVSALSPDCGYMARSTIPTQPGGVLSSIVNRLFIIFQTVVLVLSEIGWPSAAFELWLPVLGPEFGVGILGALQCFVGAAVLSHHITTFPLVSAFFLFSIGVLNFFLGFIFRKGIKVKRSLKPKAVLPTKATKALDTAEKLSRAFPNPFSGSKKAAEAAEEGRSRRGGADIEVGPPMMMHSPPSVSSAGYGFGRQGEKQAGLKGFLISKPMESLPRYVPKVSGLDAAGTGESSSGSPRSGLNRF